MNKNERYENWGYESHGKENCLKEYPKKQFY